MNPRRFLLIFAAFVIPAFAAAEEGDTKRPDPSKVCILVDCSMKKPKTIDGQLLGAAYGVTPDAATKALVDALERGSRFAAPLGGFEGTMCSDIKSAREKARENGAGALLHVVIVRRACTDVKNLSYELLARYALYTITEKGMKKLTSGKLKTTGSEQAFGELRWTDCDEMAAKLSAVMIDTFVPHKVKSVNKEPGVVTVDIAVANKTAGPIRWLRLKFPSRKVSVSAQSGEVIESGEKKIISFEFGKDLPREKLNWRTVRIAEVAFDRGGEGDAEADKPDADKDVGK